MADENAQTTQPTENNESGLVKTWVSGNLNGIYHDCLGPMFLPKQLAESGWPYVTVQPNPDYDYQKFNYRNGAWENISTDSQAQKIEDVTKSQEDLTANQKQLASQVTSLTRAISNSQISNVQSQEKISQKLDEIQKSQETLGQGVTQLTKTISQIVMSQASPDQSAQQPKATNN